MLVKDPFDFGGIDILRAGHDHVLHPVIQVEIAVGVEIAGITGAIPSARKRPRRLLRQFMIALHYQRRADQYLANRAGRQILVLVADDAQFDPRIGLAAAFHARRPGNVMILGREVDDRPAGLGRSVHLDEAGVGEQFHRPAQYVGRYRRCAIEQRAQAGQVGGLCLGMVEHHAEHRRHREHLGDAIALDRVEDLVDVGLRQNHRRTPGIECLECPRRPADMELRHGDQRDVALVPGRPLLADQFPPAERGGQAAVGQQRALGVAGGAAGVELDRDIVRRRRAAGCVLAEGCDPVAELWAAIVRRIDQHRQRRQPGRRRQPLLVGDQQRNVGVTDDIGDLTLDQPPVDHHQHAADAQQGLHQDDIIDAVEPEIGDPVARPDPTRPERGDAAQDGRMKRAIAQPLAILDQRDMVRRPRSGTLGQAIEDKRFLGEFDHALLSLLSSSPLRAAQNRQSGKKDSRWRCWHA